MAMLFYLLVWHALADFPLQGDYLAKRKSRKVELVEKLDHHADWPYTHSPWWLHMSWHALIHAGGVAFITGHLCLGLIEFVLHFLIDCTKIEGKISSLIDQILHILCKVLYASFLGLAPWLLKISMQN